jgi:hypothetical protein
MSPFSLADERVGGQEEPQGQIMGRRDADTWTDRDLRSLARCGRRGLAADGRGRVGDPEHFAAGQIPAVERAVDGESFAQAGGAAREVAHVVRLPPTLHQRNPVERLERADEHGTGDAGRLRDGIQAPTAVDGIDVRMTRRAEHARVAASRAAVGVTGRIALREVGLDLDDATNRRAVVADPHEALAQQRPRDLDDVAVVEVA